VPLGEIEARDSNSTLKRKPASAPAQEPGLGTVSPESPAEDRDPTSPRAIPVRSARLRRPIPARVGRSPDRPELRMAIEDSRSGQEALTVNHGPWGENRNDHFSQPQ